VTYGLELAIPAIVALIAYITNSLDARSSVTGAVMGYMLIFSQSFDWFLVLLVFFTASIIVTKYKYAQKKGYGVSQKRRTVENVLGNGLFPLIMALYGNPYGFFGSMATAASDTFSSEIGVLSKTRPISILTGNKVKRGVNGGVSTLGNIAMFAGSFLVALSALLIFNSWPLFWITMWAGVFGCLVDSILGEILENKGFIGNSMNNFVATAAGGIIAIALSNML